MESAYSIMNHSPHRIAFSWIQQTPHIPILNDWFLSHNINTVEYLKNLEQDPKFNTAEIQKIIKSVRYDVITIPWQIIPSLDNLSDYKIFMHENLNDIYEYIDKKDKIQNRNRNYNFKKFVKSILLDTVDIPTVLAETTGHMRLKVIDGRTRLSISWAHKHDIHCALCKI